MRVVIVAECFLPEIIGVTNSVLTVVEHLQRRHHEVLVIAPGIGATHYSRMPVERVAALELPFYRTLSLGLPTRRVRSMLSEFRDVVHLAAPFLLGTVAADAARSLGVPSVALYQADVAGLSAHFASLDVFVSTGHYRRVLGPPQPARAAA